MDRSAAALVTGGLFWYWRHHPEVGNTLSQANPGGLAVIGVLFLASIGCIAWAYWILLKYASAHTVGRKYGANQLLYYC